MLQGVLNLFPNDTEKKVKEKYIQRVSDRIKAKCSDPVSTIISRRGFLFLQFSFLFVRLGHNIKLIA